jgi:hypothetical protein
MKIIHVGDTKIIQGKHDTVWVSKRSMISNQLHTMNISGTTMEAIALYLSGEDSRLLQDVFPLLSASEREFIKSGITDEEWNKAFPEEEEE